MMSQLFVVLCGAVLLASAELIDNGIEAEPEVECGSDAIQINFNTKTAFEGHVYVKGHYDTASCREDATLTRSANLKIPFSACDVRRQRSSNPLGLYISVTVVITFHPMFITVVDKAYNVQCFYMEADKQVSTELGVSQLTTQVITQSVPMPTCTYQVLEGDADGPPVRFAAVGTQVYHKWSCGVELDAEGQQNDAATGIFCMTVHSCMVENGQGRKVQLLDENGCATDRYLLSNLDYKGDVTAGQSSMVFKFADQPTVFFQCQVRLTLKEGDQCRRTSDECAKPVRGKREASVDGNTVTDGPSTDDGTNVDVYSESITVFDLDTPQPALSTDNAARSDQRYLTKWPTAQLFDALDSQRRSGAGVAPMCLSPVTFGVLMAVLGTVLLCCLMAIGLLCWRHKPAAESHKAFVCG